jgi:hypothetical protein
MDSSLEPSVSQTPQDVSKDYVPKVANASAIEVKNLNGLSDEKIKMLLDNKASAIQEVSRGFTEKVIQPGIYKEDGETYAVCPEDLFTEDNIIGAMIYDLCNFAGLIVKTVKTNGLTTKVFSKQFIEGIWFGIFSSTNLKRRRGKKDYELGRACSFALIVKSVFASTDELGLGALCKDNFFYGNNPGEKSNNSSVPFYIKMKLRSFFEESSVGDLLYGIINYTAATVGVSYLTEAEADKVISESIIPIDQLINECYPVLLVKKGKKQQTTVRKPNPIRTSPLFTKDEMKIITDLTSSIFTDLASITADYENCVLTSGFASVHKQIKEIINLRWETLQRFANQTKFRLQDIRKITGEDKIRKASVKPLHVEALLNATPNVGERLISELKHILGGYDVVTAYSRAYNSVPASKPEAWACIYKKIYQSYENRTGESKYKITPAKKNLVEVDLDIEYRKAYDALAQSQKINGELMKNIKLVNKTKYFKLYGRFKQLELLIKGAEKCKNTLDSLPKSSVEMAVHLFYEGLYNDKLDLDLKFNARFEKAISSARQHLLFTLHLEENESLRKASALFLGKTDEVKALFTSKVSKG